MQIIRNIAAVLDGLMWLVSAICFLIGFYLIVIALRMARKRHESGPAMGSWATPISTFVTAAMFLSLPTVLVELNVSLFGTTSRSAYSVFEYADGTIGILRDARARELIAGLVAIIQFMGVIAVCRDIHMLGLLARGGHGPRTFGQGITFAIAGAGATNFLLFVGLVESLITGSSGR